MPAELEEYGFGTIWTDFYTDCYEGFLPNMSDYHMHRYYEISLILSGDVKVLLPDAVQQGTQCRLVLTRPMTSHLIVCQPQLLYKRINLLFSPDYLVDYVPEWKQLLGCFPKKGAVLPISESNKEVFYALAKELQDDPDPFRRKLRLMLFLSKVNELMKEERKSTAELPSYVTEALSYIQENYARKIVAEELAWKLGVGRTTLMTAFRKYTGITVNDYLTRYRLKQALRHLRRGHTQQTAAEATGFGDACNLIRAFKRCFGTTPGQYLKRDDTPPFSQ